MLSIRSELSKAIADQLRLQLTPDDMTSLAAGGTQVAEAYQCYLRGRYQLNKVNRVALTRAIDHFEQAIARDPTYALAYANLARTYLALVAYGYLPEGETYPKAVAMGRKALELDERVADAHAVLGYTSVVYEWNWAQGEREFQRALALDPNNAGAHYWYGLVNLTARGRHDEAIAEGRRAVALDPVSPSVRAGLSTMFAGARRYDEGIEACKEALELDADFVPAHVVLAATYRLSKRVDLAIAESRRLVELGSPLGLVFLAKSHAAAGQNTDAVTLVTPLLEAARRSRSGAFQIAEVFATLDDTD